MNNHSDILVIGAGAAGVAAGRRLSAAGADFLVIEARSRAGGRAFTQHAVGHAIDLGAGWFHSAETNPLVPEAEAAGFKIDRAPPPWQKDAFSGNFPISEQRDYRRAWAAFHARMKAAAATGHDHAASLLFDPACPWNPMLDAGSTYVNGVEFDRLSVVDFDRYEDSGVNWRATAGMGALIEARGANLPITFDCAATRIDHSGRRVSVETTRGAVSARAVIVTVSTNLIANGALSFHPALPDKQQAAARLPLGLADKLFLSIENADDLPIDGRLYGQRDSVAMGSYHLRPFGRPLIEAYFGGAFARELEAGGARAFADCAIADIASALGANMKKRLAPVACSAWARDPFALGSYSHALPGFSNERAVLAAPVDNRLFFAGEAVSKHDFSTLHGAWRTGVTAAEAALR